MFSNTLGSNQNYLLTIAVLSGINNGPSATLSEAVEGVFMTSLFSQIREIITLRELTSRIKFSKFVRNVIFRKVTPFNLKQRYLWSTKNFVIHF